MTINLGGIVDAFSADQTPKVSVNIDGQDYDRIGKYCYESDLLRLGDVFSVVLPDPWDQVHVAVGDPIKLFMQDPGVAGAKRVQKVTGVVTQVIRTVDPDGGNVVNVAAADLGWHLVNNDAPIWKRLEGQTFELLYNNIVDPTWKLAGFRADNDENTRLKLGGNYARSKLAAGIAGKPPIVQISPGDKPADIFINYAKLDGKLVNVSSDGYLQLFTPRYDTPVVYHFSNRKDPQRSNDPNHPNNNVQRATLTETLDSVWTEATCVGTNVIPPRFVNPQDPNMGVHYAMSYAPTPAPLGFNRLVAFAEPDRIGDAQILERAKWKIQRGLFDSWVYEITVKGHSQNGLFYEPETMCEVVDEFCGLNDTYYVTLCRYSRDESNGTTTTLQIRKKKLLAA